MATTAGAARTRLLERLRLTGGAVPSAALCYDVLSKCQHLVNNALGRVTATGSITTTASTVFHITASQFSGAAIRIITLTESNRELRKLSDWKELFGYSNSWPSDVGTRFECWAPVGHTFTAIYPTKVGASSVDAVYVKATTTLSLSTTPFELLDADIELVIDLAEIIFLAQMREFEDVKRRVEDFQRALRGFGWLSQKRT